MTLADARNHKFIKELRMQVLRDLMADYQRAGDDAAAQRAGIELAELSNQLQMLKAS